jgi:hypothetical protein
MPRAPTLKLASVGPDVKPPPASTVKRTRFTTPTSTGAFNVAVPTPSGFAVERRTNMNDAWIEEYQTENFHPTGDLGWRRPMAVLHYEAAARVAMRYRSRRAAS